ncbi:MAG: Holliday junction ATP-dependent DNA helicase RuvA [Caldisericia bacterium]|nr:Holliday junction ATP-dependent DNA helicase RuvA [Caldisericia bacterium]
MIYSISGSICGILTDAVLLRIPAGIVFKIMVPNTAKYETGTSIQIYTQLYVRDDKLVLYGFENEEALQAFHLLLDIPGIGAKTALSVLNTFDIPSLLQIVHQQNSQALTQVPGVGANTAKKIIPYLADKFKNWTGVYDEEQLPTSHPLIWNEAEEILLSIGLNQREIAEIYTKLKQEKESEWSSGEQIVKEVLKRRKHSS